MGKAITARPDVLADLASALGLDGYRRTGTVSVPAELLRAAAAEISQLRSSAESSGLRHTKDAARITRLSSANGALMVDRDRGIRRAAERESAALALARELAAKLGDTVTERQVTDRVAYDGHVMALIDSDREHLDRMRMGVVGVLMEIRERVKDPRYADREPELLAAVVTELGRLNDRYLKAPKPKWTAPGAEPPPPSGAAGAPAQPGLFEAATRRRGIERKKGRRRG